MDLGLLVIVGDGDVAIAQQISTNTIKIQYDDQTVPFYSFVRLFVRSCCDLNHEIKKATISFFSFCSCVFFFSFLCIYFLSFICCCSYGNVECC